MKKPRNYTEEEIVEMLKKRYEPPAWAFLPQVRGGTGFTRSRTADALAYSLWPSRGLELHGFEVKSHRHDWIRELRNPEKADEICSFSDRWWIVANKGVVDLGELPPDWGLIVVKGGRLHTEVKAPERKKVKPLDKLIFAAMLRRVNDIAVPDAKLKAQYKKGLADGKKEGEENRQYKLKWAKEDHEELKKKVQKFEEASGVQIDGWEPAEKVGDAVRIVLKGDHIQPYEMLRCLRETAIKVTERIDAHIEQMKAKEKGDQHERAGGNGLSSAVSRLDEKPKSVGA